MDPSEERFASQCKSKLMPRPNRSFDVVKKIGPNAYKVDPAGEYGVFATFNVANLISYYEDNEKSSSLRSNSNQTDEDDGDHPINNHPTSHGKSKQVKEAQGVPVLVKKIRNSPRELLQVHLKINPDLPTFWTMMLKGWDAAPCTIL